MVMGSNTSKANDLFEVAKVIGVLLGSEGWSIVRKVSLRDHAMVSTHALKRLFGS